MGYTLDQLLDHTGLNELTEPTMSKEAAPSDPSPCDLPKLAERCRNAASTHPSNEDRVRELTEKTASVAIIRHVLAEIDQITGGDTHEKTAEDVRTAAFISKSLEAGHSPEDIAAFMQKNAASFRGAARILEKLRESKVVQSARKQGAKASKAAKAVAQKAKSKGAKLEKDLASAMGTTPDKVSAVARPALYGIGGALAYRGISGPRASKK